MGNRVVWWIRDQLAEFLCWIWDRAGEARARRHARRFIREALKRKAYRGRA